MIMNPAISIYTLMVNILSLNLQFCSADGLYRKARFFFVIDRKVYPRHYFMSKEWKINFSWWYIDDEIYNLMKKKNFINEIPVQTVAITYVQFRTTQLLALSWALLQDTWVVLRLKTNVWNENHHCNTTLISYLHKILLLRKTGMDSNLIYLKGNK